MATTNGTSQLNSHFDRLSINSEDINDISKANHKSSDNEDSYIQTWGFTLPELYKLAVKFLKEKEGKALHLSYHDKLKLVAYTQQVTHGPYSPEVSPPVGALDVIGKDRRQAWQDLGSIPKEAAMEGFVTLLDGVCLLFKPFMQAHRFDLEEKERQRRLEEERRIQEEEEQERIRQEEEIRQQEEQERLRLEAQKRQIQEALNHQTYHQFKAYAEQQFPGNSEQQTILIQQLQEQHYQQYMQQVYQQQFLQQQQQFQPQIMQPQKPNMTSNGQKTKEEENRNEESGGDTEGSEEDVSTESPPVAPASMWTRKDIKEFKESIRKEGGESVIKVGHGETVTVRVPTHEDGTCLFWEFATDSYDIGFGVHFEWTKSPGNQVSVHISESEDEEEEDEENEKEDVEKGGGIPTAAERPPLTVIIPVYRRDCHEEVYAGSHVYPGQGVYLLKFDNSYSLWRSKTLYYRVYYTH